MLQADTFYWVYLDTSGWHIIFMVFRVASKSAHRMLGIYREAESQDSFAFGRASPCLFGGTSRSPGLGERRLGDLSRMRLRSDKTFRGATFSARLAWILFLSTILMGLGHA